MADPSSVMLEEVGLRTEVQFTVIAEGDAGSVAAPDGVTNVMVVGDPKVKVRTLVETPNALVTVVVIVLTPDAVAAAGK